MTFFYFFLLFLSCFSFFLLFPSATQSLCLITQSIITLPSLTTWSCVKMILFSPRAENWFTRKGAFWGAIITLSLSHLSYFFFISLSLFPWFFLFFSFSISPLPWFFLFLFPSSPCSHPVWYTCCSLLIWPWIIDWVLMYQPIGSIKISWSGRLREKRHWSFSLCLSLLFPLLLSLFPLWEKREKWKKKNYLSIPPRAT